MYFKSIELYGFKSFASKTKIDFEPGITAIVGPNGCGKCLRYDSLVMLDDGSMMKIGDMVEAALKSSSHVEKLNDGVMTYNNPYCLGVMSLNTQTLKIEARPIYAFIKRKAPKYLLEVRTKSGKNIVTTHYHPFFGMRDGQIVNLKAGQLKRGVRIAVPRFLRVASGKDAINLFSIFRKFRPKDNVYIPFSNELVDFLNSVKTNYTAYGDMSRALKVKEVAITSAITGQSMNIANFTKILYNTGSSEIPEFVTTLKSKATDQIALPRRITSEIARFLGYVISEGRVTKSDQIWFVNEDKEVVRDFIESAYKAFRVKANVFKYNKKGTQDVIIFSHALCEFLEKAFDVKINSCSRDKMVPSAIFKSGEGIIREFLSALFEGGAYIRLDEKGKNKRQSVYFEYVTASRELARGVGNLLLRLGVQSALRMKRKCATNTSEKKKMIYYSVYVYGLENVKRLANCLNFVGKKMEKLEKIRSMNCKTNPNLDLIPGVNGLFKELVKLAGINVKRFKKISPTLVAYYENRCLPSRQGILESLNLIAEHGTIIGLARGIYNYLKTLGSSDIYWDEIVGIKKVYSEEWVYDLSVLDTHNFVAQDIIVHNSNIVDGLKWVLGEQSAKDLRGSNMEDVIFNGTDTKDPVGFAEVSLTLSNESKFLPIEYEEVVITRRLFRSGESEYLLNKNHVRLKDILELFMGTGVGTSAYSIVEQGKIDMIISSKPEDRRYIFEEASGIIKYKSKKREAIRKLEYTENNILRLTDIIEEVKRQIGSIERQARKAQRYKEEFEKLKALDVKAAFLEFRKLIDGKENIEKEIIELKNRESAVLQEAADKGSAVGELKLKEADINAKLSEAQIKELNLSSEIDRAKDKIKLDKERYKELDTLKQSLMNEQIVAEKAISELETRISVLSKEIDGIAEEKAKKEELLRQKDQRLKGLEEECRQHEHNIRNGKLKVVDILSLHSKTRNEVAKISSDLSNLQARERRLKVESEEVNKELAEIKVQFDRLNKEVEDLIRRIDENKKLKTDLETDLGQKNMQLSEAEKKIQDLTSEGISMQGKLALLEDMVRRYEGFKSGSRLLLIENREKRLPIAGVHGAVAELIEVKRGYETAVEAALGDILQCIVVEDRKVGLELLNYLKDKNLGKASIVCLDSIDAPEKTNDRLVSMDGILGTLADFVTTKEQFRNLVSVLLDNVYIIKDLNAFSNLNWDSVKHAKLVTRDGEVFEYGFFTGGATKDEKDAGILNRNLQIKELEDRLNKIKGETASLESTMEVLTKEKDEILEKINTQTEILRQDELVLANKKSQKENTAVLLKKLNDEISLLNLELQELADEVNSLKARQASCNAQLKQLDDENAAVQSLITSSQSFIEAAIKEKEGLLIEITTLRTELAGVSEREDSILANLKMQKELLNSQQVLLNEKQKGFHEAMSRQEELKNEIAALEARLNEATIEKERVSLESLEVQSKKSELENLISQTEAELKTKEKEIETLKDRLHNLQLSLQENSFKLETLKTRVNQAYGVELEQLTIEQEEGFDLEAANNQIAELRERLNKMGPVNLVAIEEHQELKERFDFLTNQKEDLLNAKESLLEAIRKINKTTRELFMDTFQKVRVEFKEYFRFLFGGGQAELVLMDEQDVLECGIEIMARPPGKKLQSISLLSGGEKALTAISLLFSIFKVKPSPFCILDEVDAPLDESNIGRFTKLLEDFTKTSQFIMITHNKKTISMADVMYGITMEQSGVSKVVSVKFAKDKEQQKVQTAVQDTNYHD